MTLNLNHNFSSKPPQRGTDDSKQQMSLSGEMGQRRGKIFSQSYNEQTLLNQA